MKKKILKTAMLTGLLLSLTGVWGCGKTADVDPDDPNEGLGDLITEEEQAAAEESSIKNTLVLRGPSYTGLTNLTNENHEDGTYFYQDMTEDALTVITNMSYPNSQRDGQAPDAYAENLICAQVDNDAKILETKQDDALTSAFTYPVYRVSWESGQNEDSRQALGVVVLTDLYTYYYGYSCPLDFYEENASFYEEELGTLSLAELGDTDSASTGTGEDYKALYLAAVEDLKSRGQADQFQLVNIDEDEIPELVASDSAGSFDHENTFLYTVSSGKAVLLTSMISGTDGASLSYSEGKNLVRVSGGLSGSSEVFSKISGGKLEEVFRAEMTDTMKTDDEGEEIYQYTVNGSETEEASFYTEIAGFVKDYAPLTRADYDGLAAISYETGEGYGSFEKSDSRAYLTYEEILGLLR